MKGHAKISSNDGDPQLLLRLVDAAGNSDITQGSMDLRPVAQIDPADVAAGTGQVQMRRAGKDANGKPLYVAATGPVSLSLPNFDFYDPTKAYTPGQFVSVNSTAVVGGVILTPGTYGCRQATAAGAVGNQVPQFPHPALTANIYWILVALGPQLINVCQNGNKQIYVNSSAAF